MNRLEPFFQPRSIAIVGASERGLYPAGIVRNLLDYGYEGTIFPVNPGRESVFGLRCYPSLADLPQTPDLAIVIVPRQAVVDVVRQCGQRGVPAALIITAGFGESDETGKAMEAELIEAAQQSGVTIVGPNCAGLADVAGRVIATRLPVPPRAGDVGFVSASGALMMALYGVFADARLGLSRLISLGNQIDVTISEALASLVCHAQTHVIGAFVEGIKDGQAFASAAQAAQQAGKPLVLVKSGRTAVGQRAAATHTAALAGSDRVFRAVCEQFGVVLVDDVMDLVRTTQIFAAWADRYPRGRRIALVTQSGGMGSLAADLCALAGLDLPPLSARVQEQLRHMDHLLAFEDFGNPADVRGAGAEGAATARTLAPFLTDAGIDAVVLLLAKSSVRAQDVATAQAIIDAARSSPKPLAVIWVGQRLPAEEVDHPLAGTSATRMLMEAGIPTFEQPSDCIDALARVVAYREHMDSLDRTRPRAFIPIPSHPQDSQSPRLLSYVEMLRLLRRYDVEPVPGEVVENAEAAVTAAERIGYPVAVKLLSPAFLHKSDAGFVQLALGDAAAVRAAAAAMLAQSAGRPVEGVLVQAMAPPAPGGHPEVIAGISTDAEFGPVIAFGPGGVLVELLDEVVLRLPPLSRAEADEMIASSRAATLLAGFRNRPPADVEALAALLVNLSRLAAEHADQIVSLDLNPVIVQPAGEGISVVDVRIEWKGTLPWANTR